jgi:xylan 1,4-beta-xylosidase
LLSSAEVGNSRHAEESREVKAANERRGQRATGGAAAGTAPKDSSPLLFGVGDQAYEFECDIKVDEGTRAGLLLFYDQELYLGLGFEEKHFITHQYGQERGRPLNPYGRKLRMRLRNEHHIISFYTSADGSTWKRFDRGMEASGYHHNVRGGF